MEIIANIVIKFFALFGIYLQKNNAQEVSKNQVVVFSDIQEGEVIRINQEPVITKTTDWSIENYCPKCNTTLTRDVYLKDLCTKCGYYNTRLFLCKRKVRKVYDGTTWKYEKVVVSNG